MSFNPSALNERTLKQFVDRLVRLRKAQHEAKTLARLPKRAELQEEIAIILGFSNWHEAIHAVRVVTPDPLSTAFPPGARPETLLQLPPEALQVAHLKQGLVVVSGPSGGGKRAVLEAFLREIWNRNTAPKAYAFDFFSPLAPDPQGIGQLHQVDSWSSSATLREKTFSFLKRRPTDLFVAEVCDAHDLEVVTTNAMCGHMVWTSHPGDGRVSNSFRWMMSRFPQEEHRARSIDVLSSLRLLVGTRRATRGNGYQFETLLFDDPLIDALLLGFDSGGTDAVCGLMDRIIQERGTGFSRD